MATATKETAMTTTMRRVLTGTMLAVAVALRIAMGGGAALASDPVGWYDGGNGCWYLGAPGTNYVADCARGDAYGDFYVLDDYGNWVYAGLGYWDANGCLNIWNGATWASGCALVQQAAYGVSTMGGESVLFPSGVTITNYTPGTGVSVIGGEDVDIRGPVTTGNPVIDAINNAYAAHDAGVWLQPTCVYVDSTTCYVAQ
jgi:hypothetical protein